MSDNARLVSHLDEYEQKLYWEFEAKHFLSCFAMPKIAYQSVGIGTVIEVTCPNCGEVRDISDYHSW